MRGHASEMFQNEEDVIHAGKEEKQSARGKRVVTGPHYSIISQYADWEMVVGYTGVHYFIMTHCSVIVP